MKPDALACSFEGSARPGAPCVLAIPIPAQPGPPEAARAAARLLARAALADALGAWLGCDAAAITISSERGQAPKATLTQAAPGDAALSARLATVGLSISHAPGLTLAAWHPGGAVGVDVQAAAEAPEDPADRQRLATLYLGQNFMPNQAPGQEQQAQAAMTLIAFLEAWSAHEARLKCLGEPLQEWTPALAARLAACQARTLTLPAALTANGPARRVAAVAWRTAGLL